MNSNKSYDGSDDLPKVIPIFPLSGALLLPRGELPLNIFEPRYLAMIEDAIKGHRVIGLIQPESEAEDAEKSPALQAVGCAGRLTQFAETGDGRYLITLTGIARFRILEEIARSRRIVNAGSISRPSIVDFTPRQGEDAVDRESVLRTLREFAEANDVPVDWQSVREAPNEALVNALSMMSPLWPARKAGPARSPEPQNSRRGSGRDHRVRTRPRPP